MFCDLIQWQLFNLFTDMCSLSYVHVYRIEYVSYRQGPYRIRIVSAADRIIPALLWALLFYRQFIVSVLSVCCQSCCQPFSKIGLLFSIFVKILIHLLSKCTKIQSILLLSVWSWCEASVCSACCQIWHQTGHTLVLSWYLLPVCSQDWQ